MKIYITHCTAKKDHSLAYTDRKVSPDMLYTARPIERFMNACKERGVRWAIFSDHYGVWFPKELHKWYGDDVGDPDRVTEEKFWKLVEDFDRRLAGFDEICFYHNPGRFHRLYKRLLNETQLRSKVKMITHLGDIV